MRYPLPDHSVPSQQFLHSLSDHPISHGYPATAEHITSSAHQRPPFRRRGPVAPSSPALLQEVSLQHDGAEVLRVAERVGPAAELLADRQVGPLALRQREAQVAGIHARVAQARYDERGARPSGHLQVTAGGAGEAV